MTDVELKQPTKLFALRIIRLTEKLPEPRAADVMGRQVLRSGTSVAANYRSACRAKSLADFVSKSTTAEEEADETLFWLELLTESNLVPLIQLNSLIQEAGELTAIFTASGRTAKEKLSAQQARPIRSSPSEIRNPE
jgi:four helix bundle protein